MGAKFTIEGTKLIHEGYVVRSEVLSVRTPEGDLVEREVARHPGAVAVVAVHDDNIVLVSQYRVALDSDLIEIPAGKRDIAGEDPEIAAKRELVEEVGLETDELVQLGTFVTAAGFCDEQIIIYATTTCRKVPRRVEGPEEAHSEVVGVPVAEIGSWLTDGRITDAKTLIGLFWAREQGVVSW